MEELKGESKFGLEASSWGCIAEEKHICNVEHINNQN